MNVTFNLSFNQLQSFDGKLEAVLRNVSNGTKNGTEAACKEILENSKAQVPKDTGTLEASAFYEVQRREDVQGYLYEGIVGYGGHGNPTNLKSGQQASEYVLAVHEDLHAYHENGKAKFLEDPVLEFAEQFPRTVATYIEDIVRLV